MKLKNEALEKLYGKIVNCVITISPFANSPVDEAFKECDRELTNLRNRNDILEKSNGTLLDANFDLCTMNRDLKDRNNQLQKEIKQLKLDLDALLNRAHCAEDEAEDLKNKCSVREERIKELIDRLEKVSSDRDELQKDRDIWVQNNGEKQAEIAELKKQLDGALEAEKAVNDSRYKWAQKWLSTKQNLEAKLNEAEVKYRRLEKEHEELSIENKRLQNNVRAGYDQGQTDLWVKLQDVKDMQPNEFDVECECLGDVIDMDLEDFLDVYKKWWEQKEIDRMRTWLADFCVGRLCKECPLGSHEYKCGCGYSFKKRDRFDLRIISDEDIKRYYEKANGCGRYPFVKPDDPCSGIHEKIKEACDAFSEGLKAGLASEVKEVPVSCDIPIKDLGSWECTIEGNFEINKDLLEKVCGVKPKEEKSKPGELVITTRGVTTANYTEATMNAIKEAVRKFEKSLPALDSWESTITGSIKVDDILGKTDGTEHKLEYGDAVRLPWRDYDYMYVDADKNHIRLFNPKTHTVVLVSPSEKLTYQGCKIIICDEDDLRKIWKGKE